ncbi:MAG: hypothetical protein WCI05_11890, partial [Myxococcales bacterium]
VALYRDFADWAKQHPETGGPERLWWGSPSCSLRWNGPHTLVCSPEGAIQNSPGLGPGSRFKTLAKDIYLGTGSRETLAKDIYLGTGSRETLAKDIYLGTDSREALSKDIYLGTDSREALSKDIYLGTDSRKALSRDIYLGTGSREAAFGTNQGQSARLASFNPRAGAIACVCTWWSVLARERQRHRYGQGKATSRPS